MLASFAYDLSNGPVPGETDNIIAINLQVLGYLTI